MIRMVMVGISITTLLTSCNLVTAVSRKQDQVFEKKGWKLTQIEDKGYVRSTYAIIQGRPKIVLLHGYGASGITQYYRSALELGKTYDVILPDLLYCGRSMGDTSAFSYSIPAQVKHLELLLQSLQIQQPVTIIGNSYGGIVAAYFAEKNPHWVNQLVIYDSPINCYTTAYANEVAQSMGVASVKELLSPTTVFENKQSLAVVFRKQPYIPNFIRKQMVKHASLPMRSHQIKLLEYLMTKETQMNEHFFQWKIPVFLAWGEYDQLIPLTTCYQIADRYSIDAQHIHIFPNAAHAANVEYPKLFVEYVHGVMTSGSKEK